MRLRVGCLELALLAQLAGEVGRHYGVAAAQQRERFAAHSLRPLHFLLHGLWGRPVAARAAPGHTQYVFDVRHVH